MQQLRLLILFLAAFALSSQTAAAQSPAAAQLLTEVERYRLNMTDMQKYVRATRNLNALDKRDAKVEAATRFRADGLDEIERKLMSTPQTMGALRDAGLTPHQYMVISAVVLVVALADLMSEEDAAAMLKEAHIHPDNLKFLRANRAALNALQ